MAHEWTELIDQAVDGLYIIKNLQRCQADRAVFAAATIDGASKLLIELVSADSPDFENQRQRWSIAHAVRHPHLVRIYKSGIISLNGAEYLYCARERHDDCLEDLLASRTLNQGEAEDVLRAVLPCLEHLHGLRLAYGGIRAEHVMAVGDQTKLSADSIVEDSGATRQADDMHSVGELIVRMFGGSGSDEASLQTIPPPLRSLASGCLHPDRSARLSASQALHLLSSPPPAARKTVSTAKSRPASRAAVLAVAAVTLVLAVVWLRSGGEATKLAETGTAPQEVRPNPTENADRATFGRARTATETPPVTEAPKATATPKTTTAPKSTAPEPPKPVEKAAAGESPAVWGVIAATYKEFEAAQRRVDAVRKQLEGCDCSVFPRKGEGAKYYVLLGSGLTKEAADRLQQRATRAGLPPDTYVTKLEAGESRSRNP